MSNVVSLSKVKDCDNMAWYRNILSNTARLLIMMFVGLYHFFIEVLPVYIIDGINIIIKIIETLSKDRILAPFIGFVVVLVAVYIAVMSIFFGKKTKTPSANVVPPSTKNIFNKYLPTGSFDIDAFYQKFTPRINMATIPSIFTGKPLPKQIDKTLTDRPKINGRCDNLQNYDMPSLGTCSHTNTPEPIRWVLDREKMPELSQITDEERSRIDGGGQKYTVTIPWVTYENDGLYYYPDCSKARFDNESYTEGSAAYLFTDNGKTSCTKVRLPRTTF